MEEHVELASVVADDRQLRIDPMHQHRAQEDTFGGDAHVSLVGDAPPLERRLPLRLVGKDLVDLSLRRKP
jgi:hypothetical protein